MKRSKEERITLGDWAKALLENENFKALCNGMVADSLSELMATKPGSDEAIKAHIRLLAADDMKAALRSLQNDASMARAENKK